MFSPRSGSPALSRVANPSVQVSASVAAEIATEFASLARPGACPDGVYLTPSPNTLMIWYGVIFIHSGPYANAILRFILSFKTDYPMSAPVVRFESEVFHPLIDPKTKIWFPLGELATWRPRTDHVIDLLHALRGSFDIGALDGISEEQAVNKQIWSLYQYSRQTFLSMTAQRALNSSSARTLYPSPSAAVSKTDPAARPSSPLTPRRPAAHTRQSSATTTTSSLRSKSSRENLVRPEGEGYIAFRKLDEDERQILLDQLVRYRRQR